MHISLSQQMLPAFISMFFQVPHEWGASRTNFSVFVSLGSLLVDVAGSKIQMLSAEFLYEEDAVII